MTDDDFIGEDEVHGDIRHLEITQKHIFAVEVVHGDIRHLENN